jgi:hypothetical protein
MYMKRRVLFQATTYFPLKVLQSPPQWAKMGLCEKEIQRPEGKSCLRYTNKSTQMDKTVMNIRRRDFLAAIASRAATRRAFCDGDRTTDEGQR